MANGALRGMRDRSGSSQYRGGRAAHVDKRENQEFYKDLGISTDVGTAEAMRANKAQYTEEMGKAKGTLAGYGKEYSTAKGQYDTEAKRLKGLTASKIQQDALGKWEKDDWVTLTEPGGRTSVRMPKEAMQMDRYKNFVPSKDDPNVYVPKIVKNRVVEQYENEMGEGKQRVVYKEGPWQGAYNAITGSHNYQEAFRDAFLKQTKGQAKKSLLQGKADLASIGKELEASKVTLDRERSLLQGVESQRATAEKDMTDRYQKRMDTMREILGGFKVG